MSKLTIPAGRTIREVAQSLGLPVEELARHARAKDAERAEAVDRVIDVPDGFLRVRDRNRRATMEAVPQRAPKLAGMNAALAANLEHMRTELAGGLGAHPPTAEEEDALSEAWRAYYRFEADSNQLAQELFSPLTKSRSVSVRARAFAGRAQTHAQHHLIFGAPAGPARLAALSDAKAALMADPKLTVARLAMALALRIAPGADDHAQRRWELERGLEADTNDPFAWAELARSFLDELDLATAQRAVEVALERSPQCVMALEVSGWIAAERGEVDRAVSTFSQLVQVLPGYANGRVALARAYLLQGKNDLAESAYRAALAECATPEHRAHLEAMYVVVGQETF